VDSDVAAHFTRLQELRNPSVHYGDVAKRADGAKTAIDALYAIARLMFGQSATQFFMCDGELYVKEAFEENPFTKEFLVPHCHKLGYRHTAENRDGGIVLTDGNSYGSEAMTDDDFCKYRRAWRNEGIDAARLQSGG
jgi:hypothetical protein